MLMLLVGKFNNIINHAWQVHAKKLYVLTRKYGQLQNELSLKNFQVPMVGVKPH